MGSYEISAIPYSAHTFSYLCSLKRFHLFDLRRFPWKNSHVGEELLVYSSLFAVVSHNCLSAWRQHDHLAKYHS